MLKWGSNFLVILVLKVVVGHKSTGLRISTTETQLVCNHDELVKILIESGADVSKCEFRKQKHLLQSSEEINGLKDYTGIWGVPDEIATMNDGDIIDLETEDNLTIYTNIWKDQEKWHRLVAYCPEMSKNSIIYYGGRKYYEGVEISASGCREKARCFKYFYLADKKAHYYGRDHKNPRRLCPNEIRCSYYDDILPILYKSSAIKNSCYLLHNFKDGKTFICDSSVLGEYVRFTVYCATVSERPLVIASSANICPSYIQDDKYIEKEVCSRVQFTLRYGCHLKGGRVQWIEFRCSDDNRKNEVSRRTWFLK